MPRKGERTASAGPAAPGAGATGGGAAPHPVAAVILAAGASRRMGRNKMLLPVAGEPMVRRTARLAREGGCDPVIVVVGHEPHLVHRTLDGVPCRIAVSDDFRGPTSASLHAGLRALGPEVGAAVVLLGDMVHVTAPMVAALIASHRADGGPLEVSRYGDVLAPPLLFPRALWPELLAWTGEGCGKAVVRAHEAEAVLHDWPAAALRDVDTPADYEALTP